MRKKTPRSGRARVGRRKTTRPRMAEAADAKQIEAIRKQIADVAAGRPARWNADPEDVKRSVLKLVLTLGSPGHKSRRRGRIGRLIDDDESTLLDVLDNLLDKGVVLNADLMLALADVDLVYIRLSAILCTADRVMSSGRR